MNHFLNPANTALATATLFNIPLLWILSSTINAVIVSLAGLYFANLFNPVLDRLL